eukprot:CAMPEP_0204123046 /NCGR_PEP_ID=MMETSP0361-20130328/9062_1 /ASSEMBLY_ACC=CAM_ASM_000343 /TAXON_ID=268821 /ORGANISM="Scrippsiella Hangoei, Strain SHTV-5" /LENGTH=59 /DNA_ID=CAMNT_0051074433 /DNA_START=63 /DNA_END=240 /DNA_ORIENTATION=-
MPMEEAVLKISPGNNVDNGAPLEGDWTISMYARMRQRLPGKVSTTKGFWGGVGSSMAQY